MKRPRYIATSNLPPRVPVFSTAVAWLLLDRLDAPSWLYGVVFTLFVFLIVAALIDIFRREDVDVIGKDKP